MNNDAANPIPLKRLKKYDCPVRDILDRIGDAWTFLVMRRLAEKTMRFNELKRAIDGVSQRMLTTTLRNLERDGLLSRKITDRPYIQVYYSLTDLGRSFLQPIEILMDWAIVAQPAIRKARRKYDRNNR